MFSNVIISSNVTSPVLTSLHSEQPKLHRILTALSAIGLRDSVMDSENISLIWHSVSDGQKACS